MILDPQSPPTALVHNQDEHWVILHDGDLYTKPDRLQGWATRQEAEDAARAAWRLDDRPFTQRGVASVYVQQETP